MFHIHIVLIGHLIFIIHWSIILFYIQKLPIFQKFSGKKMPILVKKCTISMKIALFLHQKRFIQNFVLNFLPENERPWLVCVKLHVPLFCVICALIALYVSWVAVFISALVIINELISRFFFSLDSFSHKSSKFQKFQECNFLFANFLKISIFLSKKYFLNVRLTTTKWIEF